MRVDNFVKNLNSTAKKVIPVVKIAHSVAVVSNDVTKLDNQLISNAAGPASVVVDKAYKDSALDKVADEVITGTIKAGKKGIKNTPKAIKSLPHVGTGIPLGIQDM